MILNGRTFDACFAGIYMVANVYGERHTRLYRARSHKQISLFVELHSPALGQIQPDETKKKTQWQRGDHSGRIFGVRAEMSFLCGFLDAEK